MQNYYNCVYPTMVTILFENSYIRIVIQITSDI